MSLIWVKGIAFIFDQLVIRYGGTRRGYDWGWGSSLEPRNSKEGSQLRITGHEHSHHLGKEAFIIGRASGQRIMHYSLKEASSCLLWRPWPMALHYNLGRHLRSPGTPGLFFPRFPFLSSLFIFQSPVSLFPTCTSVEDCSLMSWPRVLATSSLLFLKTYWAEMEAESVCLNPGVSVDGMRE